MDYRGIKDVSVIHRALALTYKKTGVKLSVTDVSFIYIIMKLHLSNTRITIRVVTPYMRLNDRGFTVNNIFMRFSKYVKIGLLEKNKEGFLIAGIYSVTPKLIEYMGILEKTIKRCRWDY